MTSLATVNAKAVTREIVCLCGRRLTVDAIKMDDSAGTTWTVKQVTCSGCHVIYNPGATVRKTLLTYHLVP